MSKTIKLVTAETRSTPPAPPRPLGVHGGALWASIHREYAIDDAGGVEMLAAACAALDRAEECAQAIARDGVTVKMKGSPPREHPLLKHELTNRSFVVRTLSRLGLDVEAIRAPGRPPGFA